MHSQTLEACYTYKSNGTNPGYYIVPESRGLYSGYVQGVALNQVLLNNERWPFILETPLHADLTIGVDVKRHIAGFTFIDKFSKNILTKDDKTINKEGLAKSQVIRMLTKYIAIQAKHMVIQLSTSFYIEMVVFSGRKDKVLWMPFRF